MEEDYFLDMPTGKLIHHLTTKYGGAEKIPADVLELNGLVRKKTGIVSVADMDDDEFGEALGIDEIRELTPSGTIQRRKRELDEQLDVIFQDSRISRLTSVKEKLKQLGHQEVEYQQKEDMDEVIPTPDFARALCNYLEQRKIPENVARSFAGFALDKIFGEGFQDVPSIIGLEELLPIECIWNEKVYDERDFDSLIGNFPNPRKIQDEITRRSQAFQERFKHIPNLELIIHEVYDLTIYTDNLPKSISRQIPVPISKDGKIIRDYNQLITIDIPRLPERIVEFEANVKLYGVAIGFCRTASIYLDDWLPSNEELQKTLREIRSAECPLDIEKRYGYIINAVKNPAKRDKVIRLASQSTDFENLVKARIEGNNNYVDSIPYNQEITRRLNELGIDTAVFYQGITLEKFVVQGGETLSEEKIRKGFIKQYKHNLTTLLSEQVLHGQDRLEQKIRDEFQKQDIKISPKKKLINYLLRDAVKNDAVLVKICAVVGEYAERKANVKDQQKASASVFHLRQVSRFLRGKNLSSEDQDESSVYTIRVSRKDPIDDIDIGNDGGCCIGIYDDGDFEEGMSLDAFTESLSLGAGIKPVRSNGRYMPVYLEDRAISFVEVLKGKDRVGMALLFAGQIINGETALVCNSLEFSNMLDRSSNLKIIDNEVCKYIENYSKQAGFKHTYIGHTQEGFTKIHPSGKEFYSDLSVIR